MPNLYKYGCDSTATEFFPCHNSLVAGVRHKLRAFRAQHREANRHVQLHTQALTHTQSKALYEPN